MAGKGGTRRGAASLGITALLFGTGAMGGGLPQRGYTTAKNTYDHSRSTARDAQSRQVRGGTRDAGARRRGSGQR